MKQNQIQRKKLKLDCENRFSVQGLNSDVTRDERRLGWRQWAQLSIFSLQFTANWGPAKENGFLYQFLSDILLADLQNSGVN